MCWFNCIKIAHYVPNIHARTTSFGNGACVCMFMTIYVLSCGVNAAAQHVLTDMLIWSSGCANVHICPCSHACLWRSVTAHSSLRCDYFQNEPLQVGELDDRPTHRRLFGMGGRPFRTPSQGLWRTWSLVLYTRVQWNWVPWHEGTYSIATLLIREVTQEKKTRVADPFTFSVGFAQTSSGSFFMTGIEQNRKEQTFLSAALGKIHTTSANVIDHCFK